MDPAQLLPAFGNTAFVIVAFVVALSIIVAIHEYGHYIVGRWSGIHAEVFSIGFGPVLWTRTDKRGTQWQVAALPFGGYVKFLGDSNAASVGQDDTIAAADRRRTMLGAPLWARSATVAAGPVFNFILSLVVFAAVLFAQGQPSDPATVADLKPLPPSMEGGLAPGDEIVAVEGQTVTTAEELFRTLSAIEEQKRVTYTVRRDGARTELTGRWPYPPIVSGLNPDSAAYDVDIKSGDVITAVDGDPVGTFGQLVEKVTASEGEPLFLDIWRDGEMLEFSVTPRRVDLPLAGGGFETRWLMGISGGVSFNLETESPGLLEAIWLGAQQVWFIITSSLSGLWHMITGAISTCNLSGPVGIAQTSGAMASEGGQSFIWFVAVLSTAVGLLNLFPVPVLDGGHLVFHAYEALAGKPPSDGALRVLMSIGLALIGTMMIFAVANDIWLCP